MFTSATDTHTHSLPATGGSALLPIHADTRTHAHQHDRATLLEDARATALAAAPACSVVTSMKLTPVCDACDWLSVTERDGDARSEPWLVLHSGTVGSDPVLYPGDVDWCGR